MTARRTTVVDRSFLGRASEELVFDRAKRVEPSRADEAAAATTTTAATTATAAASRRVAAMLPSLRHGTREDVVARTHTLTRNPRTSCLHTAHPRVR